MDEELKEEALELLELQVLFGFDTVTEIYESICELFEEEKGLDTEWLQQELEKAYAQKIQESKSWEAPTDFQKLLRVFDQLNKEGIVSLHCAGYTRQDGEGDCHDVIHELQKRGLQPKGYCYYHAQDLARAVGEGKESANWV